jgi:hypothetical protein
MRGVALTAELHYTASINNSDWIRSGGFIIGESQNDIDLLNATAGAHVRYGLTTVTVGYSVPATASDRVFDGEYRMFVNRNF